MLKRPNARRSPNELIDSTDVEWISHQDVNSSCLIQSRVVLPEGAQSQTGGDLLPYPPPLPSFLLSTADCTSPHGFCRQMRFRQGWNLLTLLTDLQNSAKQCSSKARKPIIAEIKYNKRPVCFTKYKQLP